VSLKTELAVVLEDKTVLHRELLAASDYIVNLEDRCYSANTRALELLSSLEMLEP